MRTKIKSNVQFFPFFFSNLKTLSCVHRTCYVHSLSWLTNLKVLNESEKLSYQEKKQFMAVFYMFSYIRFRNLRRP